jgi:hypothetical protein
MGLDAELAGELLEFLAPQRRSTTSIFLFADHLGLERKSPFPSLSTPMSAIFAFH